MKKTIKIGLLEEGLTPKVAIEPEFKEKLVEGSDFQYISITTEKANKRVRKPLISIFLDRKIELPVYEAKMAIFHKIILNDKERYYFIGIGDTRKIINKYRFEANFGIKIGINQQINLDREIIVKDITKKDMLNGDNYRQNKNQASWLSQFAFSNISDQLKQMKIKNEIKFPGENESSIITTTLNDFYSIPIDEKLDKEKIFEFVKTLIDDNYNEKYRKNFWFIDTFRSVDKEISQQLFNQLWEKELHSNDSVSFSWPTFPPENHSYFQIGEDPTQIHYLDRNTVFKIQKTINKKWDSSSLFLYSKSDDNHESNFLKKYLYINQYPVK